MFYGIGFTEIIIILFIVIFIFGIGRLPEIGSGVGKAIKNFKKSLKGEDEIDVTPKKTESQNSKFKNQN